ncbi:hypothetical protein [Paenibacillus sp. BJ-4]|uniref:hypothetical protein n=1 Tax=Paenibacillus sp. BJ-4 TaxID=2878097 RepID=UPI001CF054DE|nr:hypothetical protein [Paenibacillus sp. BJ-4]
MSERIREIKERFVFNLNIAEAIGAMGAEYEDIQYLLNLIDSLQQQVNGLNEESLANFQTAAERGKQLAERDRTIALLTKRLEAAEIYLDASVNGIDEALGE